MDKERVVSQYFHEGTVAVMERTIRRLWITVILLIVLLVATNGVWIVYENQFEYYEETTVSQNAESEGDIILNGTGEVNVNGER